MTRPVVMLPHHGRRPPLGLRPWWIAVEHRLLEVNLAVLRYRMNGRRAPRGWLRERWILSQLLRAWQLSRLRYDRTHPRRP